MCVFFLNSDRNRMRDILNLHLVRDRLNTERIRQGNLHTVNTKKRIFFFVIIDFYDGERVSKTYISFV